MGQLLTNIPVDRGLLFGVLDAAVEALTAAGISDGGDDEANVVLADASYTSQEAFAEAQARGIHLLAPIVSDERRASPGYTHKGDMPQLLDAAHDHPSRASTIAAPPPPPGQW